VISYFPVSSWRTTTGSGRAPMVCSAYAPSMGSGPVESPPHASDAARRAPMPRRSVQRDNGWRRAR
jgi:hypothetical protein